MKGVLGKVKYLKKQMKGGRSATSTWRLDNTINRKRKRKLLPKNEEIFG
jgi:hypothetical protein